MSVVVNGTGICGHNQPCVSVQICDSNVADSTNCVTVSDLLVDTGSYGLRVFKSAITGGTPVGGSTAVTLEQVTALGGGDLGECMYFGSANTWGSVQYANVNLVTGDQLHKLPIQVIDTTFGTVPDSCKNPFAPIATPTAAGFNGILGVGLGQIDCGSSCVSDPSNSIYYTCGNGATGTACTGTGIATAKQVANPVYKLTTHNNGTILDFPTVPTAGSASVTGNLVFGIGTAANNAVTGSPKVFITDSRASFTTTFAGVAMDGSFIDSGSNGLFFPEVTQTPHCKNSSFFCPSTTQCLMGTMKTTQGATTADVSFNVANTLNLDSNTKFVFNDLASDSGDPTSFDWGFPFFLGRSVYTGIVGKSSSLGTGPYWAF